MADSFKIILEFLQRNQFAKAEAAFKAELLLKSKLDNVDLLSDNILGWDLQLRSSTPNNVGDVILDTFRSDSSANEQIANFDSERRLPALDRIFLQASDNEREGSVRCSSTARARSLEKRLYVEYNSGQSKSQEPSCLPSQDLALMNSKIQLELMGRVCSGVGHPNPSTEEFQSTTQRFTGTGMKIATDRPLLTSSAVNSSQPLPLERDWMKASEPETAQSESQPFWEKQSGSNFDCSLLPGDSDQLLRKTGVHENDLASDEFRVPRSTVGMLRLHAHSNIIERQELSSSQEEDANLAAMKALPYSERTKIHEAKGEALQFQNGFLQREGSFREPMLKPSVPPSATKPFRSTDHQSTGDEIGCRGYSWNDNELEKFKIIDSFPSCKAGGNIPFPNGQESIVNGRSAEEVLPRLPPVRIHSVDKNLDIFKQVECAVENDNATRRIDFTAFKSMASMPEEPEGWGVLEDGSVGQDMAVLGLKHTFSRPSVSQGIIEDLSEQLSGFATAIDGQSERWYPNDYCDSDTWEDDDDPGYHRQPIEDEEWFLANEIDYPSDDERARQHPDKTHLSDVKQSKKLDEDDRSFVDEESYFSGEEYYRQQTKKESHGLQMSESKEQIVGLEATYSTSYLLNNDEVHLYDSEAVKLLSSQPDWKGFMYQADQLEQTDLMSNDYRPEERREDNIDDDNHGSVRSGLLIGSDAADVGSEVRDSLLGGSSEGDADSNRYQELVSYGPTYGRFKSQEVSFAKEGRHIEVKSAPVGLLDDNEADHDAILQYYSEEWGQAKESCQRAATKQSNLDREQSKGRYSNNCNYKAGQENGGFVLEGFSFPSPSSTCDVAASRAGSGKSLWSNRESTANGEETERLGSGSVGPDDTLAAWKRKSNNSSPGIGSSDDNLPNATLLKHSSGSLHSPDEYVSLEGPEDSDVGGHKGSSLPKASDQLVQEDEEAAIAQEELRTLGADEDQYEIFDLRIIHRKNRTGFEEDKDFPVMINSVIAGRYHVTEYLGSAAFSKAIQAHDLYTGTDVCMKIIKNNKDFFDQSLDEIKLLKFVNKHDPADKYHVLRLYDYFYHREHLFIVCELLRANLYEFHKFNRESGGEVYFTMPRLQSIAVQCLEALEFLHRLGIIHCDLKPENILVKSYSRCEIKIIDLGSSCFQTDHLCSYVQSRSYRAPEVILGLPYDQKIDIWSLGCILSELCTGNVLFQNDSLATLLARVVGILGPLDPEVLAKGRDTYKYFTKNHMLYERNQETDQLEYLIPKKTSLGHRLPMGDQGFVEFLGYLLQDNPTKRPTASEALRHPWLSCPYEPISS